MMLPQGKGAVAPLASPKEKLHLDPITGAVSCDDAAAVHDDQSSGTTSEEHEDGSSEAEEDSVSRRGTIDASITAARATGRALPVQGNANRGSFNVDLFLDRARRRHRGHTVRSSVKQSLTTAMHTAAVNEAVQRHLAHSVQYTLTFDAVEFRRPKGSKFAPPAVTNATLSHVPCEGGREGGIVMLFGGMSEPGRASNDVWLYHTTSETWEVLRAPPSASPADWPSARGGHCAAVFLSVPPTSMAGKHSTTTSAYDPTVVIFGGADFTATQTHFNDVWAFSVINKRWRRMHAGTTNSISSPPPAPRWGAACGSYDNRFVVFGGETPQYVVLGDTHVFDLDRAEWLPTRRALAPTPSPRCFAAHCVLGERILVSGGLGETAGTAVEDHTWVLEMRSLFWRQVASNDDDAFRRFNKEGALFGHTLLPFDDVVVLISGSRICEASRGSARPNTNAWVLDLPNERWHAIHAPTASAMDTATEQRMRWPAPRHFPSSAPCVVYSATAEAPSLASLLESGLHLTDDKEMHAYLSALQDTTDRQSHFAGIITILNGVPTLAHSTSCLLYGGSAGVQGPPVNEMYRVQLQVDTRS